MATTMNILQENVILESEFKDVLKNKMRCLMSQSYNMFQAYAEATKQSYFDIIQDIQVEGGEKFHLTTHLSAKKNLVTCSATAAHGITLELSASFGESEEETVLDISAEEAKNCTSVVNDFKVPEKEELPKKKETPPMVRNYGVGYKIPKEMREEIAKQFKAGKSVTWIMETYNVCRSSVHNIAIEYNLKKSTKGPHSEMAIRLQQHSDDIITSFAKGQSIVYCSNLYQISRAALSNFKHAHQGAIELRQKELAAKESGLNKEPIENDLAKNPGIDKESYIIEDLIKGELDFIKIASKYQTTTAIVEKIADLNSALIKKRQDYMKNKKNDLKKIASANSPASEESLQKLKEHFGGN